MNKTLHKTKGKWSKLLLHKSYVVLNLFKSQWKTLSLRNAVNNCEETMLSLVGTFFTYDWQKAFTTYSSKPTLLKSSDIGFSVLKTTWNVDITSNYKHHLETAYDFLTDPERAKLTIQKESSPAEAAIHQRNRWPYWAQNRRSVSLSMTSPVSKNAGRVGGCRWSITAAAAAKPLHQ